MKFVGSLGPWWLRQKWVLTFGIFSLKFWRFPRLHFGPSTAWKMIVILIVSSFLWRSISPPLIPLQTRVTACDVGQGDAILVQHGTWTMLIDAGPNSDVLRCLTLKMPWWKKNIDVFVLTHAHMDHIGGVEAVLSSFRVGEVWRTSWSEVSASGEEIEEVLSRWPQRTVFAGESLSLPGMRWRVLWGEKSREVLLPGVNVESEVNAESVGLWGGGGSFGFLALGDLGCPEELAVGGVGVLDRVSILKVSHHGSKSSTCLEFLKEIQPETAIISSGEGNSYGHPHPFSLENLQKMGVFTLRTDQLGTFSLSSRQEGTGFQITTEN